MAVSQEGPESVGWLPAQSQCRGGVQLLRRSQKRMLCENRVCINHKLLSKLYILFSSLSATVSEDQIVIVYGSDFYSTGVLKLNFDTLEGVLLENNQVVVQMSLRRLSTPSSEVEKFQPLATVWKWYWNCEDSKWQEYGQVRTHPQWGNHWKANHFSPSIFAM